MSDHRRVPRRDPSAREGERCEACGHAERHHSAGLGCLALAKDYSSCPCARFTPCGTGADGSQGISTPAGARSAGSSAAGTRYEPPDGAVAERYRCFVCEKPAANLVGFCPEHPTPSPVPSVAEGDERAARAIANVTGIPEHVRESVRLLALQLLHDRPPVIMGSRSPVDSALMERLAEAERSRNAARATVAIVQGIVAEMHADATKPKGGQTVGPRRMPVPLSVILELERALGPAQGEYTAQAYYDLTARASAAEAERDRLRAALGPLMALIENGTLVRDISRDGEPGWAMKQLPLVKALASAKAALSPAAETEPEARPWLRRLPLAAASAAGECGHVERVPGCPCCQLRDAVWASKDAEAINLMEAILPRSAPPSAPLPGEVDRGT